MCICIWHLVSSEDLVSPLIIFTFLPCCCYRVLPSVIRSFSNRLIFDTGRGVALLKEEKRYKGRNDDHTVRQAGRTNISAMRSNRKELEGTHIGDTDNADNEKNG